MARYEDLAPLDYFGASWADRLVAVGWVESAQQCDRAAVEPTFFEALVKMLADPWQPFAVGGLHRCCLCRFTGGPSTLQHMSLTVQLGVSNLFVFGEDQVYVAPSTIVHYIDAHEYCPPPKFQDAVLASPTMRSMDYLKLVRRYELHRMGLPAPA
jgi:hypothetical protein